MKHHPIRNCLVVAVSAAFVLSCASKKPVPKTASSADSPTYAIAYPAALNTALTAYTEDTAKAKEKQAAFSGYRAEVSDADPAALKAIYVEADATGRGQAYADKAAEARAVRAFFDREKDDIARRVNGNVVAAKEKAECQCELDTYGTVSYALKDSVDKRLEKSLQEAGEVSLLIERNEKALGKKNLDKVENQADAVAWTAHTVFVSLPSLYEEMSRMLSEAKDVKKTWARAVEEEKAREADPAVSKSEKKDLKKRIQALEDAKGAIDIFVGEAERQVTKAETEIPAIQDEYEKAFKGLVEG